MYLTHFCYSFPGENIASTPFKYRNYLWLYANTNGYPHLRYNYKFYTPTDYPEKTTRIGLRFKQFRLHIVCVSCKDHAYSTFKMFSEIIYFMSWYGESIFVPNWPRMLLEKSFTTKPCLHVPCRVMMAKFKEDLLTSKESPTGRLLTEWEKRNKNLPQFVQAMKDIGRLDVVEAIKRIHGSTPRGSPAPTRANWNFPFVFWCSVAHMECHSAICNIAQRIDTQEVESCSLNIAWIGLGLYSRPCCTHNDSHGFHG